MKEEIRNILTRLETGEISSRKAIKLIKNLNENNINKRKPANKIKILIIDGDDNKKINLPGIPFWLATFLGKLGILIAPLAIKRSQHIDQDAKIALEAIKNIDIKEFIDAIRECGPFDIIDVCDDKDVVKISVL